jgi:hypothetical protein
MKLCKKERERCAETRWRESGEEKRTQENGAEMRKEVKR